ncbi:GntR family transcriptional regulator [Alicyclobacillus curvatus]|nr:GntR family transcriptional regulator [Alicyclobacillus curvatus]
MGVKLVPPQGEFKNRTLAEQVREMIQNAIVDGKLKPGQAITEMEISEMLDMSRTPVREAFRLLTAQGFLNIVPRKGVFVSKLSLDELEDMYAVRIELEAMAMRLAVNLHAEAVVGRLTENLSIQEECVAAKDVGRYIQENIRFHEVFSDLCGNSYLRTLIENIETSTLRYRAFSLRTLPGRMDASHRDHEFIRDFIRDGKLAIAEQVLRDHILVSKEQMAVLLTSGKPNDV